MRRIELEHVQDDATDDRQVGGRMIALHGTGILAQHHIESPVQVVLDRPVPAGRIGQVIRVEHSRADVVARLEARRFAVRNAQRKDATQARALGPLFAIDQTILGNDLRDLHALSPMPLPDLFIGEDIGLVSEGVFERLAQAGLVSFDRQQVVGAAFTDLPSQIALSFERIEADQRAAQLKRVEQVGNRAQIAAFVGHLALCQHQRHFGGEGADHVERVAFVGAPKALSINSNMSKRSCATCSRRGSSITAKCSTSVFPIRRPKDESGRDFCAVHKSFLWKAVHRAWRPCAISREGVYA